MYAKLDDFDNIIKRLMHDHTERPIPMYPGEELAILSLLLRVYILPDLDANGAAMVRTLCDKLSDDLIAVYPFCEGYIDYLYGAAAFRRGGF